MCEVIDLTIEPTIIESITPIVSRVRLASEVNSEKDSEVPLAKRLRMDDEKKEDDEREIDEVIEPETCESELVCDNVTTRKETKSDSQRAFEEAKEGGSSDSDDSDDSNDSDDES